MCSCYESKFNDTSTHTSRQQPLGSNQCRQQISYLSCKRSSASYNKSKQRYISTKLQNNASYTQKYQSHTKESQSGRYSISSTKLYSLSISNIHCPKCTKYRRYNNIQPRYNISKLYMQLSNNRKLSTSQWSSNTNNLSKSRRPCSWLIKSWCILSL